MTLDSIRNSCECHERTSVSVKDSADSSANSRDSDAKFSLNEDRAFVSDENEQVPSKRKEILSYSYHHMDKSSCDIPEPRWRHSSIHAVIKDKECIVIFGGRSSGDTVFGDFWSFDVSDLEWEKLDITGDKPTPSHSHTACLWQDTRMVIAGGLGSNLCPLTSVYVIDLETCSSQEMKLRPRLPPRYSHTAHVIGDNLLLVGGVNPIGTCCYTVSIINLITATWCLHSLPAVNVERPLMVHGHTSELLTATSIVIIGGGGNCFSFGTHLNDTPVEISVPL